MSRKRINGRVSVVVTNYNRGRHIVPCLNSLIQQSYPHVEIIVVDDHSSDGSYRAIRAWREQLSSRWRRRVYVVTLPRNAGYAGALTTAMFLARGEYIAIQDGDDLAQRDRLKKQVRFLQTHAGIGVVGTNYAVIRDGHIQANETANWLEYGPARIRAVYRRGGHCVSVPTMMFRARYFQSYGGLTNRLHGAEDYDLLATFMKNGVRVDNLKEVLYYYRNHQNQRSRQFYG